MPKMLATIKVSGQIGLIRHGYAATERGSLRKVSLRKKGYAVKLSEKLAIRNRIRADVGNFFGKEIEIGERAIQVLEHSSDPHRAPNARHILSAALSLYPSLAASLIDSGVELRDGYLPDTRTIDTPVTLNGWHSSMPSCFGIDQLPGELAGSGYRVLATRLLRVEDLVLGPIEAESIGEKYSDLSRLSLWYMAHHFDVKKSTDEDLLNRFEELREYEFPHYGKLRKRERQALERLVGMWNNPRFSGKRVSFFGRLRKRLTQNFMLDPSANSQQFALEWDGQKIRIRPFGLWGGYQLQESPLPDGSLWVARGNVIQPATTFSEEAIDELEYLIAKDALERDFQTFFELNPEFLIALGDYIRIHPQLILREDDGRRLIPDFFLEKLNSDFSDICDLKRPTSELVRYQKNRFRFRDVVRQAVAQLEHYRDWFEDKANRDKFYNQWSGQLAVCGLSHHAAIRPVSITSTINGSFRSNSAQRPS